MRCPEIDLTSAHVDWVAGEETDIENLYQIILQPGNDHCESFFSCAPSAFFQPVFKNADKHFATFFKNVLSSPEGTLIKDIDYLPVEEFREINTLAYGSASRQNGATGWLHALLEKTAAEYPGHIAVVYEQQFLSYNELNRKANRLAHFLLQQGVQPGDFIGILLKRTPDVYVVMLGILKAGAAYVPLDAGFPQKRISYILNDAAVKFLITHTSLTDRYDSFEGKVLNVDEELIPVLGSASDPGNPGIFPDPQLPAYVIYTSGSTGWPKGVIISHAAVANLVKTEQSIFKLTHQDKVAQGFSIAFDASVEEIWLAFLSGAALFPVPEETMLSATDLPLFINRNHISVLSTIPTILSMAQPPLPSLRLLISGGEYCPQEVLQRWHTGGLRIVNTYGPTEATVIATCGDFDPKEKPNIGKAVSNYAVFITDAAGNPVPAGVPGELCIAGKGLANGYLNRSDLTVQKFIIPSFDLRPDFPRRIYRSGDLARFNENGQIEFLGRLDLQVKLRGYRVELSEIESQLLRCRNIKNAVAAVKEDEHKVQRLIAYVLLQDPSISFNEAACKKYLGTRLASYMVPAIFVVVKELPLLPSGKVDRNGLPDPDYNNIQKRNDIIVPRNTTEQEIYEIWEEYFSPHPVSVTDDFFLDLGGHSLLVAQVVSRLRKQQYFHDLSILDVYRHPTIEKLAKEMTFRRQSQQDDDKGESSHPASQRYAPGHMAHFVCGVLQFISLYIVFGIHAFMEVAPFLIFFVLLGEGYTTPEAIIWAIAGGMILYPMLITIIVLLKWLILGRVKPGRYRLWSLFYVRWWLVQTLVQALHLDYLSGTPLLPFVLRMLGLRIGRNVHLETDRFAAFDLTAIGDGTSIDEEASLLGYKVENGIITVGPIHIGHDCFVGARAVISPQVTLENGARLDDLSLLSEGTRIPAGETWAGSPAQQVASPDLPTPLQEGSWLQQATTVMLYLALIFVIPLVFLIAFVPGVTLLMQLDFFKEPLLYLAALPVVGASFVLLLTIELTVLKWLLVGRVKPGTYPVHGGFYIRNWIVDQLLKMSLDHVGQLHATLYILPWYRSLGAKLGRFVELSTASSTTPDLLSINDESTVADEVSLGSPRIERGWMTIAPTCLGRRTFIGNSAVVPAGSTIGDHSLVGVLSIPPKPDEAMQTGATWLGSPPVLFPHRQPSIGFSEANTYRPSRKLRLSRKCFELLRITLPPAGFIFVTVSVIITALELAERIGFAATFGLLPLVYMASCLIVLFVIALVKWIVIGRYKSFTYPLWSFFVWRLELVNALYEFLATPLILEALQGTPFLPWYLRLLGARIGHTCYIDTTGFLEWDLVEIGDRVALGEDCIMQTHLFEDRVLKASRLRIGSDCTVGATSVILYDTTMEDGSSVDALSLLMKGESIPAGTKWAGCPSKFIKQ